MLPKSAVVKDVHGVDGGCCTVYTVDIVVFVARLLFGLIYMGTVVP